MKVIYTLPDDALLVLARLKQGWRIVYVEAKDTDHITTCRKATIMVVPKADAERWFERPVDRITSNPSE